MMHVPANPMKVPMSLHQLSAPMRVLVVPAVLLIAAAVACSLAPTPSPTVTPAPYASGTVRAAPAPECVDLETGSVGICDSASDFLWNRDTGGAGIAQYHFVPQNAAVFARITGAASQTACEAASLSSAQLDGGRYDSATDSFDSGDLPAGAAVCYRTAEGRIGYLTVTARQPDFNTWQIELSFDTFPLNQP
jgi:hypothetical protein